MDKRLFERLVESMQQHEEIRRSERPPSREFFVDAEKAKLIRAITGLSQAKFARLLAVDVGTLRNWEQGVQLPIDHLKPSSRARWEPEARQSECADPSETSSGCIMLATRLFAQDLVHDALYPAAIRLVAGVPDASSLKQSILSHHTTAEDAGRVAQAAGVKTLVLSHLVPPDEPELTDQMWIEAASA